MFIQTGILSSRQMGGVVSIMRQRCSDLVGRCEHAESLQERREAARACARFASQTRSFALARSEEDACEGVTDAFVELISLANRASQASRFYARLGG